MISKKYLRAAALGIGLPALMVGAGFGVGTFVARCTEKIVSQQQLEEVVEEEREKMNVPPDYQIASKLKPLPRYLAFTERRGREYTVYVNQQKGNSRGTVRHELCHILYGDVEEETNSFTDTLQYWLWEEPRAVLCSILR